MTRHSKAALSVVLGLGFAAILAFSGHRQSRLFADRTKAATILTVFKHGKLGPASRELSTGRKTYPYSIIPGGIATLAELQQVMNRNPEIAAHLASFDMTKARAFRLAAPRSAYVSFRIGGRIWWTTKTLTLARGELLFTDGNRTIRGRCGNDVSDVPWGPASPMEPSVAELDTPMEGTTEEPAPVISTELPVMPLIALASPTAPTTPGAGVGDPSTSVAMYPPFYFIGSSAPVTNPGSGPVISTPETSSMLLLLLGGIAVAFLWVLQESKWMRAHRGRRAL